MTNMYHVVNNETVKPIHRETREELIHLVTQKDSEVYLIDNDTVHRFDADGWWVKTSRQDLPSVLEYMHYL